MGLLSRINTCCILNRVLIHHRSFNSFTKLCHRSPPKSGTRASSFFNKLFTRKSPLKLKESDNIPDSFTLIYRNKMSNYLVWGRSMVIACGGFILLFLCARSEFRTERRDTLDYTTSRSTKNEEVIYITILTLLIVSIQMMVSRIPIRIYKVPNTPKYIGIMYGNLLGTQRFSFTRSQIKRAPGITSLPWHENRFVVETNTERKTFILIDYYFRRPADLSIMIGEQKDPELDDTS